MLGLITGELMFFVTGGSIDFWLLVEDSIGALLVIVFFAISVTGSFVTTGDNYIITIKKPEAQTDLLTETQRAVAKQFLEAAIKPR